MYSVVVELFTIYVCFLIFVFINVWQIQCVTWHLRLRRLVKNKQSRTFQPIRILLSLQSSTSTETHTLTWQTSTFCDHQELNAHQNTLCLIGRGAFCFYCSQPSSKSHTHTHTHTHTHCINCVMTALAQAARAAPVN